MKIYKANKKEFIYVLILSFLLAAVIYYFSDEDKIITLIILLVPLCLLFWMYFDTGYKIKGRKLHYRSAFIRGKISINKISRITTGKTMWSGTKPALARNGLIVEYKYGEIYIAPENNAELIADLLAVNPGIKVIEAVQS